MFEIIHGEELPRTTHYYRHDRIEVTVRALTRQPTFQSDKPDFDGPTEELRFTLLGEFQCEFASGPGLSALARHVAQITGAGWVQYVGCRRLN
jgi:hypothetical protein